MEKENTITGVYYKDESFINVFVDNRMYTISRTTRDWDYVEAGSRTPFGVLTKEQFDQWKSKADKIGTFTLK